MRRGVLVAGVAVGLATAALALPQAELPTVRRAEAAAEETAAAATELRVMRVQAAQALDNAMAVRREAVADLVQALRDGAADQVDTACRVLAICSEEAGTALERARRVAEAAAEAEACAHRAGVEAGRAQASDERRVRERAADRAERARRDAQRALKRALPLCETLKERWLLPVVSGGQDGPPEAAEGAHAQP
jgi:hypothetical protein